VGAKGVRVLTLAVEGVGMREGVRGGLRDVEGEGGLLLIREVEGVGERVRVPPPRPCPPPGVTVVSREAEWEMESRLESVRVEGGVRVGVWVGLPVDWNCSPAPGVVVALRVKEG